MSTRQERLAEAREKLAENDPSPAEVLSQERAKKRARAQKREHAKVVKALEKELEEAAERQAFLDALEEAPDPAPFKIKKKRGQEKGKGSLPAATYFMLASDWHMGERVRPENVGNKNEYNPEIAQERAEEYFESQLTLLTAARSAWDVRQGVLWLGGDLMTGYIHEEYLEENFLSPTEESLLVHDTMIRGIDHLLAESDFEHLLIPTSNGNHGRTGQKIKIASYARNSFEWLLYQFLARHYADEPRVTFQIANGYNNIVDCYGFRVRFHHGDAIKYAGGVGGLTIPTNRRIGRLAMGLPPGWETCHLDAFGHFHQSLFPGNFIVNGSLIGYNDFAERIGCPYEIPAQTSFVVDERYLQVNNYNKIIVDKKGHRNRRNRRGSRGRKK